MDIVTFASLLSGYLFFGFAIFWSVLGLALHRRLDAPVALAVVLTFTLQFLGMAILVIRYFAIRAKNESQLIQGDWDNASWSADGANFSADWDSNTEDWESSPSVGKDPLSWTTFGLLTAAFIGFLITIWLPWFYQSIEIFDPAVYVFSSGLEVWLLLSMATFGAAAALTLFHKTYLWTVLLVAHFSNWWLALSLASLVDRLSFARAMDAMFNLPNLITGLDGFGLEFVNQTAGEAWFVMFPSSVLAVGAVYLMARDYSLRSI